MTNDARTVGRTLSELHADLGGELHAGDSTPSLDGLLIDGITADSRKVTAGSMFVCIVGEHSDGHDFAPGAVADGAVALLVERRLDDGALSVVPQVVVDSTRRRVGEWSAAIHGHPSASMTTVGITGTNGKTTTCSMLAAIFEAAGQPTGVIGTLHGTRTTPEAPELQGELARFVDNGKQAAVLEVSSHALELHRVDGTRFDAVVFTNLGHDHLDLHGTTEEYFRAKAALFEPQFSPLALINADDTHGSLLIDVIASSDTPIDVVAFSVADLEDVNVTASTISYRWRDMAVQVAIGGTFNVSNSLAALETARALGIDPNVAAQSLASLAPVPGRFERVDVAALGADFTVVVDYAHTPDGLTEVLDAARDVVEPDRSVIVVFGCGGDRDQAKRPAMGAAAARGADHVVITSDNPRTEDAMAIIGDIKQGMIDLDDANVTSANVTSQVDRRQAIGDALDAAQPGDVVVIAGKGHELTQDLGDRVIDFDDRSVVRDWLSNASGSASAPCGGEGPDLS